ncbi:ADP-ribosylation factor GTPase-activating protein 1 [Geosmithia morbida]|uniref:ADP-ribosylation factor GTPase-activating protein 1 n=1 Tax=Geosmithia morbida TaxID=1094350 RepID=A0A9P4YVB8_9HYPO|nr:ADP-ribosylation factor GTPase-activating protein 1 [Geosmithia morbida]KAF4123771.1 ADP-ribosylation factor GTPase-activating protein 1 [Geosmithia morbida]
MATKAMWEVDPETRSKLSALQRESSNGVCCDCSAPSPQWASPKFGIFICLTCAGKHRGLGVHISFVRSVSMDAFKAMEIERMRLGGNDGWRRFYEQQVAASGESGLITWTEGTDADRYTSEAGEEYKDRLTCKVEGKEYVASEKKAPAPTTASSSAAASRTASRSGTPSGAGARRGGSPSAGAGAGAGAGTVRVDDAYFSRLGADNASRPDHIPPSQGGKYAGFGNTPEPAGGGQGQAINLEDVQKDAVAAITKGFGWFTSTVTRTAKNVNDGYFQPASKQFAESDFARQAQLTAAQIARQAQMAGKNAQEGINKLVEGPAEGGSGQGQGQARTRQQQRRAGPEESRRSFWDDFSNLAGGGHQRGTSLSSSGGGNSAIGTSAMGMGKSRAAGGAGAPAQAAPKKQNDEWDDW